MSNRVGSSGSGNAVDFDPYHKWLGIHPDEQPPNFYRLLGVALFESDADVIANAADARMAHVKTFHCGEHSIFSQRILNEVASAKICLLSKVKKTEYDRQLHLRMNAVNCAAPPYSSSIQNAEIGTGTGTPQGSDSDTITAPSNFPLLYDIKPRSTISKLSRKKSIDSMLFLGLTSATVLAVAVILLIYLKMDRSDNLSAASKSGTTSGRRIARTPHVNLGRENPVSDATINRSPINPKNIPAVAEQPLPDPIAPQMPKDDTPPEDGGKPRAITVPSRIGITLPSGRVLTEPMLEVSDNWKDVLFPPKATLYVATWPNGDLQGIFTLHDAKLDGWAIALYENGSFQTLACYKKAQRENRLIIWKEDGERLFYAEYKNGRKNGLFCLFKDDLPWLFQEWDKDNIQNEYLVIYLDGEQTLVPKADMKGKQSEVYNKAILELHILEATLEKNENQLKKNLAEWFRKEKERGQWKRHSGSTPDKLRKQLDKIDEMNKKKRQGFMEKRNRVQHGIP